VGRPEAFGTIAVGRYFSSAEIEERLKAYAAETP
jgi:hypothetical protein